MYIGSWILKNYLMFAVKNIVFLTAQYIMINHDSYLQLQLQLFVIKFLTVQQHYFE